ncbi:hypothetical protein D9M69_535890 [compost metagenome]
MFCEGSNPLQLGKQLLVCVVASAMNPHNKAFSISCLHGKYSVLPLFDQVASGTGIAPQRERLLDQSTETLFFRRIRQRIKIGHTDSSKKSVRTTIA